MRQGYTRKYHRKTLYHGKNEQQQGKKANIGSKRQGDGESQANYKKGACTHIHPETYTQFLSAKTACSYLLVMLQPENTYSLYMVYTLIRCTVFIYEFFVSLLLLLFHFICIQF